MMRRALAALVLAAATLTAAAPTLARQQQPQPQLTPGSLPSPAAVNSAQAGSLKSFTGQLLDVRGGYAYFTTGDAFKIAAEARIVDFQTGAPVAVKHFVKLFARATLDPATRSIVLLAITRKRLAPDAQYDAIKSFAAETSPYSAAPELVGKRLTGKAVAVTFFVQVPATTPLTDDVFITTDASGWLPNALRMDRVDAIHYRLTRNFASGTKFAYKYTRGSWNSVELDKTGLLRDPRSFFVNEVDARQVPDIVYGWSDQTANNQNSGPNAIPTPYNPIPFTNFPSTIKVGQPQPQNTMQPNGLPPGCPTATTGNCKRP
ncbi:MAG: hypothetical protein WCE44_05725 [Candidatus Velthaea sp.]